MQPVSRIVREGRDTLLLALPIIVGQVSQMLLAVTDSIMIGHAGTVPLAASSFGGNVFLVFYVLGIGMTVPVSTLAARSHGAAKPEEAAEYLRHGLAIAIVFGILETALLVLLSTQLHRFGQPAEVLAIVRPFFVLIGVSITPVLVYLVFRQFSESLGRPWMPMFVMLGGVVLNVGLNWVFIFGHLGAPALGLTGAGLATLICRILTAAAIVALAHSDPRMRGAWPRHWFGPLSGARLREMLHVAIPATGMLFFESSAFTLSTIMMGWLGSLPLAAHQIAISCASFSFMFPLGLSIAAGVQISRAVGANQQERLRPIGVSAIGLGIAMMAVFGVAFGLFGRAISGWFVTDPAVVALATQLLVVAALFQLFDGWQVTETALLRGIGDVRVPAAITFVAYWVISLPLGYALGIRGPLGAMGLWIGIASGLAFAAIFLAFRFAHRTHV